MLSHCLIEGCETWKDSVAVTGIVDHFKKFHGTATMELKSQKAKFEVEYDDHEVGGEGTNAVKVPFIIEYDGVHFLFVVNRSNKRHYFWLYFVEDGILSDGRQFHADLALLPTKEMATKKESEGNNIVYPITTPVDEIIKKSAGKSYFVSDKGLKTNYLQDKTYRFVFSLKELERKVIQVEHSSVKPEDESCVSVDTSQIQKDVDENEVQLSQLEKVEDCKFQIEEIRKRPFQLEEMDENQTQCEIEDTRILLEQIGGHQVQLEEVEGNQIQLEELEKKGKGNNLEIEKKAVQLQPEEIPKSTENSLTKPSCNNIIKIYCSNCNFLDPNARAKAKMTISSDTMKADSGKSGLIFSKDKEEQPSEETIVEIKSERVELVITPKLIKVDSEAASTGRSVDRGIILKDGTQKNVRFPATSEKVKIQNLPDNSSSKAVDDEEGDQFKFTEEDLKVLEFFQTTWITYSTPERMFPSYRRAAPSDKEKWMKVIRKKIGVRRCKK